MTDESHKAFVAWCWQAGNYYYDEQNRRVIVEDEFQVWQAAIAYMESRMESEAKQAGEVIRVLVTGIEKTINENLHLADGDVCTLYALKQALAEAERIAGLTELRKDTHAKNNTQTI
jgi:hypothetical protein